MSAVEKPLRSPLKYYGGKGHIARHIVALLPPHVHYVEVFGGGGSVLFRKEPSSLETINDVHEGVTTLYQVLRDPALFAAFARLASLTPYSRDLWDECTTLWQAETDPVRKAWRFFVCSRQSFCGDLRYPSWSYSIGKAGASAVTKYLSAVEALPLVHERLRRVQVDHADWRVIVDRYDDARCVLYCDPPYELSTRTANARYDHELTLLDHHALTERLLVADALVVLSGYRQADVHGPLEDAGWERVDIDVPVAIGPARRGSAQRRVESVWRNPAAVAAWEQARQQQPLFSRESGTKGDA